MKIELKALASLLLLAIASGFGVLGAQEARTGTAPTAPLTAAIPGTISAKVTDVLDGDTLRVTTDQHATITVRLDSIDAPEMAQPFGLEAKQRLSELVLGKPVVVRWKEKDKYGRTLGIVYLGDVVINRKLVDEGFAWNFVKYSKSAALAKAEQAARVAKAGLWETEQPIAPWAWRDGVRPKESPKPIPASTASATIERPESTSSLPAAVTKPAETTVYVTETGDHYHRSGCQYLRKSAIPIPLSRAASSYTPCSKCRPPE